APYRRRAPGWASARNRNRGAARRYSKALHRRRICGHRREHTLRRRACVCASSPKRCTRKAVSRRLRGSACSSPNEADSVAREEGSNEIRRLGGKEVEKKNTLC